MVFKEITALKWSNRSKKEPAENNNDQCPQSVINCNMHYSVHDFSTKSKAQNIVLFLFVRGCVYPWRLWLQV